jgi:hypothetical protein
MKKPAKSQHAPRYQLIFAFFGATPSLLACVLYEYHAHVVIYRPFDLSNTIALYMAMLSVVFWIAYLITRFVKKSR